MFFSRAISTSFLPSSCWRSAMRRSYCCTVLSSAKSSGPRSRKALFQSATELKWMPYSLAICPGIFSPVRASMTTWNLNLAEYRFLAMTDTSSWRSPGRSVNQLRSGSTLQYPSVQLLGVSTVCHHIGLIQSLPVTDPALFIWTTVTGNPPPCPKQSPAEAGPLSGCG